MFIFMYILHKIQITNYSLAKFSKYTQILPQSDQAKCL